MRNQTILVVDDDQEICSALSRTLKKNGFDTKIAIDGKTGLELFAEQLFDAVLLDLSLPDIDGIEIGREMIRQNPACPIILITAHGSFEKAVAATKCGIYDFIAKPFERDRLLLTLRNALNWSKDHRDLENIRQNTQAVYRMIGASPGMQEVYSRIDRVAPLQTPVLILGENGVGKDLAANAIHSQSNRTGKPMIKLNCSAIPDSLLEAELFGHTKGAFTGAYTARTGKIQAAHKSSLFLDEIGDLSLDAQAKLLRFLESGEVQKIGSNQTMIVDTRVIAATNRDLAARVDEGAFRQDLYYRLEVFTIHIPPLRERRDDILELFEFFIERLANHYGVAQPALTPAAKNYLLHHDWPGNVRQFKHALERLIIMNDDRVIDLEHVKNAMHDNSSTSNSEQIRTLRQAQDDFSRDYIRTILQQTGGNISQAADLLGIDRRNFYRKLDDLGLR